MLAFIPGKGEGGWAGAGLHAPLGQVWGSQPSPRVPGAAGTVPRGVCHPQPCPVPSLVPQPVLQPQGWADARGWCWFLFWKDLL